MCPRYALFPIDGAFILSQTVNLSKPFLITSLADHRHLTPIESHPYEKRRGGGMLGRSILGILHRRSCLASAYDLKLNPDLSAVSPRAPRLPEHPRSPRRAPLPPRESSSNS